MDGIPGHGVRRRSASMSRVTAAPKKLAGRCRPVAHGGLVHHQVPGVVRPLGELSWAQVSAGDAALGPVIKDAKEQLRALPDGLTYGLLRYLNTDVDLAGSDPAIGFNYLGRLGAGAADLSDDLWRIDQDGVSITAAATAVPTPLGHTRGAQRRHHGHRHRSASARDMDVGAARRWMTTRSAGSSQLWFDALAGICAHVQQRWRRADSRLMSLRPG